MVLFNVERDTELVECQGCSSQTFINHAVYDERKENHFCDMDCFEQWAHDNPELMIEFYKSMNVS